MSRKQRRDQTEANGETPVFDASQMRVRENDHGQLALSLAGGGVHASVEVAPAFPISRPNRFIYFRDEDGKELGLLVDPRGLDRESRDLVLAHADEAYFMPCITRIVRVVERTGIGIAEWQVETDRGYSRFDVVSRAESVWWVGRSRLVIRDADGNRYLIEDLGALDRRSRRLADLYL